tara:strand:- start:1233 stop:1898 length:666 start_codon:yes stop_codon:yes gene_type:complete
MNTRIAFEKLLSFAKNEELTEQQAADLLGVSKSTISRWKRFHKEGNAFPSSASTDTLVQWALNNQTVSTNPADADNGVNVKSNYLSELKDLLWSPSDFTEMQSQTAMVDLTAYNSRRFLIRSVTDFLNGKALDLKSGQVMMTVSRHCDVFICLNGDVFKLRNPNKPVISTPQHPRPHLQGSYQNPWPAQWDQSQEWLDNYLNGWLDAVIEFQENGKLPAFC